MTEKEALNASKEQMLNSPWNEPCFVIVPGRYFHAMFHLRLPPGKPGGDNGGDITGLVWRFDAESDLWTLTYRFRYYIDHSGDPNAPDRKNWYAMRWRGGIADMEGKLREMLCALSGLASVLTSDEAEWQWLAVGGDCRRFFDIIEKKKNRPGCIL